MRRIRFSWLILAVAVALVAAMVAADLLWLAPGSKATREGGGMEAATAMLYFYAAGVWLWQYPAATWRRFWHIPLVILMMAGREYDLDVALTHQGLLTTAMYFTDRAPIWERLLGAAIIVLLATIVYRLIALSGRDLLRGLRQRALWAWATLGGIALAVLSINIDGIGRKLRPLGVDLSPETVANLGALEEVVELFIPILFLIAVLAGRPSPEEPRDHRAAPPS